MNSKLNASKALAMKTIVFIAACLLLQACSSNSAVTPSSTLDETDTESSSQPVVVLPDVDILPGEQPPENTLQNTMWRLSSLERDDGSIYSPQPELSYFLSLNDDNFRIQFWCVYREGNYSVLNDGVLTTTSLNDMEVFSCPPPPTTEPADIEDILASFFDGKTIMFVQTESELELSSASNEVLRFAACETNCLNDDNTSSEDMVGNVDTVLDRTWLLTTVQDSSGNQMQVAQEAGFEFTIRLSSNFVEPGGDVVQEVMSVGGINVCNFYSGGYTLDDGLLTLITVSEEEASCERADELPATIFGSVLFTYGDPLMLVIDTNTDVLTISSGTNESLLFQAQQE